LKETAFLEARGLTKVFSDPSRGSVLAVDEVSFKAGPGEILGLLGPNGAGKTTTLRMLATVLTPTSGTAVVAGKDILEDPVGVRRSIGFLSGTTALYARLTPRETLRFFGRLHGMEKDALEERIEALLERLELLEYASTRLERLSTGNQQKVNLARAVLHDPPVLILDEPTTGLDVLAAATLMEFLEDRKSAGRCTLFSTHILSEVERLCDRVAIIYQGSLEAAGTVEELAALTGETYLERIFLALVKREKGEGP